ncbi:MAG TPA: hypothetical protein VGS22_12505 [Thermoanaerobaculia bacterium]|nr:hypothetical protein [Thermoanaerobaculia bacterium]
MILTEENWSSASRQEEASPLLETTAHRWALGARAAALWGLAVLGFLLLCFRPLDPTGLWAHLSYGDWILAHRALPVADPILPLAEGMPILDASWLSQAILAAVERAGDGVAKGAGVGWLAALFALLRLTTAAVLLGVFRRVTGGWLWSALGLALVLALVGGAGGPWAVLGPATFGALCMAVLLRKVVSIEAGEGGRPVRRAGGELWAAAGWAALFALWANLHVSFALGLAVLALGALGRLLEVLFRGERREGVWRSLVMDRPFRRWLLLAELAAAATLINPHGIELWLYALRLRSNPNLASLPGWRPLSVEMAGGWVFGLMIAALLWAFRRDPSRRRPVSTAQALWLIGFGGAALAASGLLAPCAPLFAVIALPHVAGLLGDGLSSLRGSRGKPGLLGRAAAGLRERLGFLAEPSWHKSVLALALLWAAFALSPVGASLLRGEARAPERTVAASAPLALGAYLTAHPPAGLTFVPMPWADWLAREGPKGRERLRPFANTGVEVLPAEVWQDYLRVAGGSADWQRVLDRYGVRSAIFDREAQHGQIQSLRYADDWRLAYEDDRAFVFERTTPAGTTGGKP